MRLDIPINYDLRVGDIVLLTCKETKLEGKIVSINHFIKTTIEIEFI